MANNKWFSESFILLQQEGHLVRSCLTNGLTAIRRATVADKGTCYTAFFQLSVGIERLLKLIFIVDHMATNNLKIPSKAELKAFGHDIVHLVEKADLLPSSKSSSLGPTLPSGSIEAELFYLLSEFGKNTRYHNLDRLSQVASTDPLSKWHTLLERIARECLSRNRRNLVDSQSGAFASDLTKIGMVVGHDLNGKSMEMIDAVRQPMIQKAAAPHALIRLFPVLQRLERQLDDACGSVQTLDHKLGRSKPSVPTMYEFFDFMNTEKKQLLRKQKWP